MAKISMKNVNRLIKESKKEKSAGDTFLDDLNRFIQKSQKDREPSRSYKPSQLNCIRNAYYQMIGEKRDEGLNTPNIIGINEIGSFRHEVIQDYIIKLCESKDKYEWIEIEDYIKEKNITDLKIIDKIGAETKCYHKKYNLSFMTDGILKICGEYVIFEYKTETCFKAQNRKEVDKDHYNQAICYSLAFGINNVLFLYENRDNCTKKFFPLKVTPLMRQSVIDKILECDSCVKNLEVPDKEEGKLCNYCKYKKACERDGDGKR